MSRSAPAVALGLVGSLIASLPGVLRTLPEVHALSAWLALSGALSLVVVPVALWIRHGRGDGWQETDGALLRGAALSSLPLALFGGVLKSSTHHRPLGGATFAVVAVCVLAVCIGLAFRFSGGVRRAATPSLWQKLFFLACVASLVGTLLLGVVGAGRSHVLDFVLLTLAVALTALVKIPAWLERAHWAAPLLSWAALLVLALWSIQSPELARLLTTRAPVSFASLSWLGGGS